MSKWELLRATIKSSRRDPTCNASIHSFTQQFKALQKSKVLWQGFQLHLDLIDETTYSADELLQLINDYFHQIDCAEYSLLLSCSRSSNSTSGDKIIQHYITIISHCSAITSTIEDQSVPFQALLRLHNSTYQPIYRRCEFHRYKLPSPYDSTYVYVRELPKNKKVTAQDILSDQIFGVDNTGNICVWPCESLLLYLLLKPNTTSDSLHLSKMIQGKKLLELGGGMTGLVGLGLAISGLSSDVTITDGHPFCVVNQVYGLKFEYSARFK